MLKHGKLIAAVTMLCIAGFLIMRFVGANREREPMAYFYDLSEQKLFTAPQSAVPPIVGMDGKVADGVRAIVYSPSGDCEKDKKIAYLEKYSDELKRQFEAAKASPNGDIPRMSRGAAQGHTFVCRAGETNWFSVESQQGNIIMDEWRLSHPGMNPTVCIP